MEVGLDPNLVRPKTTKDDDNGVIEINTEPAILDNEMAIENADSAMVEDGQFTMEYIDPFSSAKQVVKMVVESTVPQADDETSLLDPIRLVKLAEPDEAQGVVEQVKEKPSDAKNEAKEADVVSQNLTVLESQLKGIK